MIEAIADVLLAMRQAIEAALSNLPGPDDLVLG
jgi:hypothetical protein